MADKQALGARADLFAAHNSKQAHDVVAADPLLEQEGEDTTVAAVGARYLPISTGVYSTALRTRLTHTYVPVTRGFSPHTRFGGFLPIIPPRLNMTKLRGLSTITNYYNAVLHSLFVFLSKISK
jgi:hypothetical protein